MEKRYSVGFSEFRNLMDLWDNYVFMENIEHEIQKFLDHKQILMFFKYPVGKKHDESEAKIYGATEDGRLGFARMKSPNPEDPEEYQDNFTAFDLKSLLNHTEDKEEVETIKIFDRKDLKKIKIMNKEDVVEELSKSKHPKEIEAGDEPEKERILTDDE
jgi:hypothetical protein